MAALMVSEEVLAAIEAEVKDGGYADANEYVARLVRQDQKRRAKEQMEAMVLGGHLTADE